MLGRLEKPNSSRELRIPLRNIVIEMSRKELLPQDARGFEKLESFKVIHLLRQDAISYAGICNIRLRSKVVLDDLIGVAGFSTAQLLSKESTVI
jgi:hypothetical protein